jgi:hypothetical protein
VEPAPAYAPQPAAPVEPVEPVPSPASPAEPTEEPAAVGGGAGGDVSADSPVETAWAPLSRSLVFSGAAALALAVTGLAMVGWRRRQW